MELSLGLVELKKSGLIHYVYVQVDACFFTSWLSSSLRLFEKSFPIPLLNSDRTPPVIHSGCLLASGKELAVRGRVAGASVIPGPGFVEGERAVRRNRGSKCRRKAAGGEALDRFPGGSTAAAGTAEDRGEARRPREAGHSRWLVRERCACAR